MRLLVLKRDKIVKMEGILLQDGQEVKGIDDSGYKYIGILETDQLKEKETKDIFSKEYKHRLKIVPKTKLSGKKKLWLSTHGQFKFQGIALVWYNGGV